MNNSGKKSSANNPKGTAANSLPFLFSTNHSKDLPTATGGERNCKSKRERPWRAEKNRYPPLTRGKPQSALC